VSEFGYEKLGVWQKGMDLVTEIYLLTSKFPADEKFGITSQLRRAAISIPANLAEGYGRGSQAHLANFAKISLGSVYEVRTELEIAIRTGIASKEQVDKAASLATELSRMLDSFVRSVVS
jgi:four helix bundle protein